MTSNLNNYISSSAHIFGIAVVNGATHAPSKPRTVILEAAFWNGDSPVLGLFRFFNEAPGIAFAHNERYLIYSTVSLLPLSYVLFPVLKIV